MKIAVASLRDPRLIKTFSGIPAHIIFALEKRGHTVSSISLTPPKEPWHYRWLRALYYRLQGKWFLASVEDFIVKTISYELDEQVSKVNPDVVLAIHSDIMAYSNFKQPGILIDDTTFASKLYYYNDTANLTTRSINNGNKIYKKALDKVAAAIFSADWASRSAINDYNASAEKIYTIEFGANLKVSPVAEDVDKWIARRAESEVCNLLFLGIDWQRKGGPDALNMVVYLNSIGVKACLTIVGCTPVIPENFKQFVNVIGLLNKSIPSEAAQLVDILQKSSALLLPSLAECYGCVFCEANAYGLPALGRVTGGIPQIIKQGVNGLMLEPSEQVELFAEKWASIWMDKEVYKKMAKQSLHEFETRLNYDVFVERLEQVVSNIKLT